MKNLTVKYNSDHENGSATRTHLRRIGSAFIIAILLGQILLIGPIQKSKASGRISAPAPVSAPPEPFHFTESPSEPLVLTGSVLPAVPNLLSAPPFPGKDAPLRPATFLEGLLPSTAALLATVLPVAKTREVEATLVAPTAPPPPVTPGVKFDFDGNGKADVGRWHPDTHEFKIRTSVSHPTYPGTLALGGSTSIPAPGDFNGDGITDAAVYNPGTTGTWSYLAGPLPTTPTATPTPTTISLGILGNGSADIPMAGDYDGDGTTDAAVYRPGLTGTWYVKKSSNGGLDSISYGASGDIPITGDFDGDGKTDEAVYRVEQFPPGIPDRNYYGFWHINRSHDGDFSAQWGNPTDIPVQGDFDGDGESELAVYRPSDGTWYVARISGTGIIPLTPVGWGNYGDQPAPADYDGDGKTDHAVWRPTTGVWYIRGSVLAPGSCADEGCPPQYLYRTLGVAGDTAIPSAYTKQIGGTLTGYGMAAARLSPRNATGGTNLYSQNFSWGAPLVSLPGRAGLDAGFGISYNSLVWIRSGNTMSFDPDTSNVSPGFRFGFPVIEPVYYDSTKGSWAYMMVTPDGSRKEFRQLAASNQYETADSGYTQLVTTGATSPNAAVEDITIKVTSTDGTQLSYAWLAGAFRCSKVLDRNGNYISINHDAQGVLRTVTDTLGREITVVYDAELNPVRITQNWSGNNGSSGTAAHDWAKFAYTTQTVTTNFGGGITYVAGPPNTTVLKVLEKITYADDSYTKFAYNSYAQVTQVQNYAADNHELNRVRTNLDAVSDTQSDCPRFTHTYTRADNFNLSGSGTPQETDVENTAPASSSFTGPNGEESTDVVTVAMVGHSELPYTRTHFATAGSRSVWKEGLPVATEDCMGTDCSDRKRWTWTNWEQDEVNNSPYDYLCNPRVIETQVGDGINTKRTTRSYYLYQPEYQGENLGGEFALETSNIALFGLVQEVDIYGGDLNTVIKKSVSEYNLASTYQSRRIIGLPSKLETWGWDDTSSQLQYTSQLRYAYDEGNFSDSSLVQNISPVQHDNTAYGSSFVTGRGNLTSTTRCDASTSNSGTCSGGIISRVKYNTAGSPVAQIDPLFRTVRIGYADSFNSTGNPTTYAYPTTMTDTAGSVLGEAAHSSTTKYRYDIGAAVETKGPAPTGQTYGVTSKRVFDNLGRLDNDSIYVNTTKKSYTRYEHPANGIQSKVYSTIIDTNANGPDTADEVLSESWMDGVGRVRGSRTLHPGSTGGWSATRTEYDIVGRVRRQSVPTEVSVAPPYDPDHWTPAGDDAGGYRWSYQKYDWKGRVTRKINTDGDPNQEDNPSDVRISYEGCGCAGGQVTAIQGEEIIGTDWDGTNPASLGRRTRRIHEDILGRPVRSEVMDWDGSTAYSSTVNTYNGRDQITNIRQYAGATSSSTYRDVTMEFDGHGRMATRHYPVEDASAQTSWEYNHDDSINKVTDPRGVVTNFAYFSATGLLHTVGYDVPSALSSTVPDPGDVTFAYDNLGNRTSLSDDTGSASFIYDSLSRMTSETKTISALYATYTTNYTYTLAGAVNSVSDPQTTSRHVDFVFDKLGGTTGADLIVGGSTVERISGTNFRAWGAVKEFEYENVQNSGSQPIPMKYFYDSALRVNRFETGYYNPNGNVFVPEIIDYNRFADGKVKQAADSQSRTFDRTFNYDSIGRLIHGNSGKAANGDTSLPDDAVPYSQAISYNSFSEETGVNGRHWDHPTHPYQPSVSDTTGRIDTSTYDAAGNVLTERIHSNPQRDRTFIWDAAGRQRQTYDPPLHSAEGAITYTSMFDGDGKRISLTKNWGNDHPTTYELRSTVLGGEVISKIFASPVTQTLNEFMVPVNGVSLKYSAGSLGGHGEVEWSDPEGISSMEDGNEKVFDPRGADVGTESPYDQGGDGGAGYPDRGDGSIPGRCSFDQGPISCSLQDRMDLEEGRIRGRLAEDKAKKQGAAQQSKQNNSAVAQTARTNKPSSLGDNPAPEPTPPPCVEDEVHVCTVVHKDGSAVPEPAPKPSPDAPPSDIDNRSFLRSSPWGNLVDFGVPKAEPTSRGTATPVWRLRQQDAYDNCVRDELRHGFDRHLAASAKMYFGGSLMVVGGAVAGFGSGYFVKEAMEGRIETPNDLFIFNSTISHAWIPIAAAVPIYGEGYVLADSGVNTARLNSSATSAAIQNCRVRFPNSL